MQRDLGVRVRELFIAKDGKPARGQLYMLAELPALVERDRLPKDWNAEGKYGPDRYIEAQLWDDQPLQPYQ